MNKEVEDRICNYSGLLSVEQYQWIEEEQDSNTWSEDEWYMLGHS